MIINYFTYAIIRKFASGAGITKILLILHLKLCYKNNFWHPLKSDITKTQQSLNMSGRQQPQNNQLAQPAQKVAHLFYSEGFCEHSKRCKERIAKLGLGGLINLWNIDNPAINIPPFIQSVPTIYLADSRKILVGRELFEWIEQQGQRAPSTNQNIQTMASITGSDSICAWSSSEIAGGGGFAFIDDAQNQLLDSQFEFLDGSNGKDKMKMAQLTRIGEGDIGAIPGQNGQQQQSTGFGQGQSSGGRSGRGSSDTDKAYQRMMEERNAEMQNNPMAMRR
jgi:hypothetical protein